MSNPFGLSKQRLEELQLAWNEIRRVQKCKANTLNLQQFVFLLKSIGIQIQRRDLRVLRQEYNSRGEFVLEDFIHVGSVGWTDSALEQSLITGLKVLDKQGTGFVPVAELRETLYKIGIGIRLSLFDIDTFLQQFEEFKSGKIPLDKLVLRLLAD